MKTLIAFGVAAGLAASASAGTTSFGTAVAADGLDNFLTETITVTPGYDGNAMLGPAFGSGTWGPGDMFGITSRPAAADTQWNLPFAMADQSNIDNAGDQFGLIKSTNNGRFFGINDSVNGSNPDNGGSAEWTFDITGATGLSASADFAAMGDFEASDAADFMWSIDGSTPAPLFSGSVNEAGSQDYVMENGTLYTVNDPFLINGVTLNNDFQNLSAAISGTGSVLTISFYGEFNGGDEPFAFRDLEVSGIPTPGSVALLGLGGLAAARRRRA